MINRDGAPGAAAALRAAMPMDTIPVGAGVLIGPDGGQVAGLVDGSASVPDGPGAAIDSAIADLDARISALEEAAP